MPKGNIQNIFPEKYNLKKKLNEDWQSFCKRETYLTSPIKEKFFNEINQLRKFPRSSLFNLKIWGKPRLFRIELRRLRAEINNHNPLFIENRLRDYSTFFNGKDDNLSYSLDNEQRLAVIKDKKHNLVTAGAGSGKTCVISARIAYLVRRKDKIDKDRILALTFT